MTVSFSSFALFFLSDDNWVFSDINITWLNHFSIVFSSSFNSLISFLHQQISTHLSTDTKIPATCTQFCSSSIATSKLPSTYHSFHLMLLHHLLFYPPPTISPISTPDNNFLFSVLCNCVFSLCLVISLSPLSIHNWCILSIYLLTFL